MALENNFGKSFVCFRHNKVHAILDKEDHIVYEFNALNLKHHDGKLCSRQLVLVEILNSK